jgi:uncharacterized protein YjaZ
MVKKKAKKIIKKKVVKVRKPRLKETFHQERFFYTGFYFLFGPLDKVTDYLLKKHNLNTTLEPAMGYCIPFLEQKKVFVWMEEFDKTNVQQFSIMAHELQHVTFRILEHVGFTHSHSSEEIYCYLLQHLIYTVLTKF